MIADIFITLKAHAAQQELEKTITRINQWLEVAKSKVKTLGQPKTELSQVFLKEYIKFKNRYYRSISAKSFAKILVISRSTLYKYIKMYE